jgi:hypothetical protein
VRAEDWLGRLKPPLTSRHQPRHHPRSRGALFDRVSRLTCQQDKIVEFIGPIVEEFKRKAG